jgi:hypothetical protein
MFFKTTQHAAPMSDVEALSQSDAEITTVRGYQTSGTEVASNGLKLRN